MTLEQDKLMKLFDGLAQWLPDQAHSIKRLKGLMMRPANQVVAAGLYNHGKSSLLNALIGRNVFSVADCRETRQIQREASNGIVWVDTPGLDADVAGQDDLLALDSVVADADVLLLVHNVRAGELDQKEFKQFSGWLKTFPTVTTVVLTQIDQLEKQELDSVIGRIREQLPNANTPFFQVSSTRAFHSDERLRARSGLDELRKWIDRTLESTRRPEEIESIKKDLQNTLQIELSARRQKLSKLNRQQKERMTRFQAQVQEVF